MPSRDHYGDILQQRAVPWRAPLALWPAAALLSLVTFEADRAAVREALGIR